MAISRLLLQNCMVIDGTGRTPQGPLDLWIEGDRIRRMGSSRSSLSVPPGTRRLDLTGMWVLPGLIDAHVHLAGEQGATQMDRLRRNNPVLSTVSALENARRTVLAGFTSVRNASAPFGVAIELAKAVDAGRVTGPEIFASGRGLSITGGHGDPQNGWPEESVQMVGGAIVDSPDEARRETRRQLREGARAIKLFATGGVLSFGDRPEARGLTEEEMRAAVEEAHNVGVPVLAHAQGTLGIKNAIRAGVDSIEHGIYLDEEAADMMAERGTVFVPTLSAPQQILAHAQDSARVPPWAVEKTKAAIEHHWRAVALAHARGVRIVLGTDAGTPFNFHGENGQELRYLVEAGLTPMEAIQAATGYAAALLGSEAGVVAEGRPANLIVTPQDPLADIEAIADSARLRLVILRGRIIREGRRSLIGTL